MSITMSKIQSAAADALLSELKRGVTESDDPHRIYEYIEGCGAVWDLDWSPDKGFDASVYWCGYAVGWAYINCGDWIDDKACYDIRMRHGITQNCMGSTSRLAGKLNAKGDPWASLPVPMFKTVDFEDIRRGDICVVATGRTVREWGDHITLALGSPIKDNTDTPYYETVEGNVGDKIVNRTRTFEETAKVYRPGIEHFVGSLTRELNR